MSEKMFIARDQNCNLYLYYGTEEPALGQDGIFRLDGTDTKYIALEPDMCWEVRPGQCREIEITYKD